MKSSGIGQRKILQCIPANTVMRPPEEVFPDEEYGLVGGMALGQLIAEADEQHARALDQGNAFTFIQSPPEWWPLLAGPVVYARELPASWVRGRWTGSTRLRPQYMRLPMGSKHAALILIVINKDGAKRALARDRRWNGIVCLNEERHRS